jgi:hypothetical protein
MRRTYNCLFDKSGDTPAPQELFEWNLVERFGWTLTQVRSMTMQDIENYIQIYKAKSEINALRK